MIKLFRRVMWVITAAWTHQSREERSKARWWNSFILSSGVTYYYSLWEFALIHVLNSSLSPTKKSTRSSWNVNDDGNKWIAKNSPTFLVVSLAIWSRVTELNKGGLDYGKESRWKESGRKQKSGGDQGSGVEKRGEWGRIELSFHLRFCSLLVSTRLAWWNVNLAWSGKQHRRSKIGQRERKERVKNAPSCDLKWTEMREKEASEDWTQAASWYYGTKKQDE